LKGPSKPGISVPVPPSNWAGLVAAGIFGPKQPGPKQVPRPLQKGHHDLSHSLDMYGLDKVAPTPTGLSRKWKLDFVRHVETWSARQNETLVTSM
jgi:hypothetical protein